MHIASTTSNVMSDPTFQGFRAKLDTEITNLVNIYMLGVRDVLSQADSAPTGVLFWVSKLENSDTGKLLLAVANPDNASDGDGTGAGPSDGGST